jgi:hypothetical protein
MMVHLGTFLFFPPYFLFVFFLVYVFVSKSTDDDSVGYSFFSLF